MTKFLVFQTSNEIKLFGHPGWHFEQSLPLYLNSFGEGRRVPVFIHAVDVEQLSNDTMEMREYHDFSKSLKDLKRACELM